MRVEGLELRDSSEVRSVEVHDTIREVTTITVDRNDKGDTLRQSIVTDRYRGRDASQLRDKSEKIIVKTDTVYVPSSVSHQKSILKWIFAVICAIIGLIITVKVCLRRLK